MSESAKVVALGMYVAYEHASFVVDSHRQETHSIACFEYDVLHRLILSEKLSLAL